MADIVRRMPGFEGLTRWDPFGVMESLGRWDPFQQLERMLGPTEGRVVFTTKFEVKETKDTYLFKGDVPGIKESDLEISLTGNRLTISGKREEEERHEEERYYAYERSYGSFSRTFTLPEDCDLDHVNADLREGVLTVAVPKKEKAQPKRISLKGLKERVSEKLKA